MAIATGTALAIGGIAAVTGAIAGSAIQARAAGKAAQSSREAGQLGADIIEDGLGQSLRDANSGYDKGQRYLDQAGRLLADGQTQLGETFGQERALGTDARERLRQVLLGGNIDALQLDPAYAFRQAEGEKAIQRQAAAAGSFGSGGNLKDFARFGQGLASEEYGNAINRLLGLSEIGSRANLNYANMGQALLGARAGVLGQKSDLGVNRGNVLAQIRSNAATNRANALIGAQGQANNFALQQSNAIAHGIAGTTRSVNDLGQNYLTYDYLNRLANK